MIRRANVLAVDSSWPNLMAIERALGRTYDLLFANSGTQALETIRKRNDIDLVLLDADAPEVDAFTTATQLRGLRDRRDLPIVFTTGAADVETMRRAFFAGAVDFLVRPIDAEILRNKIAIYASLRVRAERLRERESLVAELESFFFGGGKPAADLFESRGVGALVLDEQGRLAHFTDAACRLVGADLDSAPFGEQMDNWWESEGRTIAGVTQAVRFGETSRCTQQSIRGLDAIRHSLLITILPLRKTEARGSGALVLLREVVPAQRPEEAAALAAVVTSGNL